MEHIPYEESLILKDLGFNEPCFCWYNANAPLILEYGYSKNSEEWLLGKHCTAPLYQQVFDFFREKYNLEGQVKSWKEKGNIVFHYSVQPLGEPSIFRSIDCSTTDYYEARLLCLQKLIKTVKTKIK